MMKLSVSLSPLNTVKLTTFLLTVSNVYDARCHAHSGNDFGSRFWSLSSRDPREFKRGVTKLCDVCRWLRHKEAGLCN